MLRLTEPTVAARVFHSYMRKYFPGHQHGHHTPQPQPPRLSPENRVSTRVACTAASTKPLPPLPPPEVGTPVFTALPNPPLASSPPPTNYSTQTNVPVSEPALAWVPSVIPAKVLQERRHKEEKGGKRGRKVVRRELWCW